CLLFCAGLRTGISQALKAKDGLVKVRGLLGVTDVKFDVISALQREKILLGCWRFLGGGNGAWHGNPSVNWSNQSIRSGRARCKDVRSTSAPQSRQSSQSADHRAADPGL